MSPKVPRAKKQFVNNEARAPNTRSGNKTRRAYQPRLQYIHFEFKPLDFGQRSLLATGFVPAVHLRASTKYTRTILRSLPHPYLMRKCVSVRTGDKEKKRNDAKYSPTVEGTRASTTQARKTLIER